MKNSAPIRRRGFTLVEMLAVITIIVILAGIVLGGLKFAKQKENQSKATIQVAFLSKAIEEYKLDTGAYPVSTSTSGEGETARLRQLLYLDGVNDPNKVKKIYLAELDETSKQGWINGTGNTATIVDPWGQEYRFLSGANALNQDFDVWSCGKDAVTKPGDKKHKDSLDDIRN